MLELLLAAVVFILILAFGGRMLSPVVFLVRALFRTVFSKSKKTGNSSGKTPGSA